MDNGEANSNKLKNQRKLISEKCTACSLCLKDCAFLRKYGHPKTIADSHDSKKVQESVAFECSLCGLCQEVCPEGIDPGQMFLEMRREAVFLGQRAFSEHRPLLKYEKRGISKRYTWYGFPRGCQTILFPGCALSGNRPATVFKLYEHLIKRFPDLGVVLDCCTKPSHDLGREEYFHSLFQEMREYLLGQGIKTVLVACPNCYKIFKEYGAPLQVKTVYEFLAEDKNRERKGIQGSVTVHDPCVTRFEKAIQDAVRNLIQSQGLSIEEMEHHRTKTLCCGEGGAVGLIAPELAGSWGNKIKPETRGKRILTYCAGCVNLLNRRTPTDHVLDFFFEPEATLSGRIKGSKAPITYWNRIRLKKQFQKMVPALVTRERTF
ncbi:MAG: (Fe-S)-binding protein [Deltaproteobacteria bacterium]|nr:(Fe-S)-binding protein [Deltaproteobacteria bacterium]